MNWDRRKQSEEFARKLSERYTDDKGITKDNPITFAEWCYLQGRADERTKVLEEIKTLIGVKLIDNLNLTNATKYGNKNAKQQSNSYATVMKYEIADCVDDLLEDLEQLKESK